MLLRQNTQERRCNVGTRVGFTHVLPVELLLLILERYIDLAEGGTVTRVLLLCRSLTARLTSSVHPRPILTLFRLYCYFYRRVSLRFYVTLKSLHTSFRRNPILATYVRCLDLHFPDAYPYGTRTGSPEVTKYRREEALGWIDRIIRMCAPTLLHLQMRIGKLHPLAFRVIRTTRFPRLRYLESRRLLLLNAEDTEQEDINNRTLFNSEEVPAIQPILTKRVVHSWISITRLHLSLTPEDMVFSRAKQIDYHALPNLTQMSIAFADGGMEHYVQFLEALVVPQTVQCIIVLVGRFWEEGNQSPAPLPPPTTLTCNRKVLFACHSLPYFLLPSFEDRASVSHLCGRILVYGAVTAWSEVWKKAEQFYDS